MKIFSVIFSLYIILLACLPCGDASDCTKVTDTNQFSFYQTEHSGHTDDAETCSPFCICACCGTNIAFSFQFPVVAPDAECSFRPEKATIAYQNEAWISNFYGNIWQPPKI
jgi:hypothetical protein